MQELRISLSQSNLTQPLKLNIESDVPDDNSKK